MTTRAKYLIAIPAIVLLAILLLLYRLADVTAFMVERQLHTAGFTDIVVDIQAITTTQSKITMLRATRPSFSLHADGRTGNAMGVSISYLKLYEEVRRGTPILLDDGAIEPLAGTSTPG